MWPRKHLFAIAAWGAKSDTTSTESIDIKSKTERARQFQLNVKSRAFFWLVLLLLLLLLERFLSFFSLSLVQRHHRVSVNKIPLSSFGLKRWPSWVDAPCSSAVLALVIVAGNQKKETLFSLVALPLSLSLSSSLSLAKLKRFKLCPFSQLVVQLFFFLFQSFGFTFGKGKGRLRGSIWSWGSSKLSFPLQGGRRKSLLTLSWLQSLSSCSLKHRRTGRPFANKEGFQSKDQTKPLLHQ